MTWCGKCYYVFSFSASPKLVGSLCARWSPKSRSQWVVQWVQKPQPIGTNIISTETSVQKSGLLFCPWVKDRAWTEQGQRRQNSELRGPELIWSWAMAAQRGCYTAEWGLTASWWVNGSFQSKLYRLAPKEQSVPRVWEGTLSQKTNPRAQPLSCCLMKTDHFLKKLCIYLLFFMPMGFVDAEL